MRRRLTLVATGVALCIPTSVAPLIVSSTAGAASSITCSKLTGSASTTVTISKCLPSAGNGYKKASVSWDDLINGGDLTWSSSGATTTIGDTSSYGIIGACHHGHGDEIVMQGTVTAASSGGTGVPAVGDTFSAFVCQYDLPTQKFTLMPGTEVNL